MTFLTDYAVHRMDYFRGDFPKFAADDSANASEDQAVATWLTMPRPDGVPKMLLKRIRDDRRFLLIRCPIVKWAKWEEEAIGWNLLVGTWNKIGICV